MDKTVDSQLELFSQSENGFGVAHTGHSKGTFFSFAKGYEKTISIIFVLVITGVVAFCLGVEKGKKTMAVNTAIPQVASSTKQALPVAKESSQAQPTPFVPQENYTIQLASYQTRLSAQKEADILRKKGMVTLLLSKGRYIVVCVGKFGDKVKAGAMLAELKKQSRYQDSFIRRL